MDRWVSIWENMIDLLDFTSRDFDIGKLVTLQIEIQRAWYFDIQGVDLFPDGNESRNFARRFSLSKLKNMPGVDV
jgi:hypothetical protein